MLSDVFVPGHGSVAVGDEVRARMELDHAYALALRDGGDFDDPRIGSTATPGWEWVSDIHAGNVESLGRGHAP
jgi:hypothetical protein